MNSRVKILHTSDWHLGKRLHNYDRGYEYAELEKEVFGVIERERPDVFLLSGDVFDNPNPSLGSEKFLGTLINRFRENFPDMSVIITAGNHDSGRKLDNISIYARACPNLKIVGELPLCQNPETGATETDAAALACPVYDSGGRLLCVVAAVPYVPRMRLYDLTAFAGGAGADVSYEEMLRTVYADVLSYIKDRRAAAGEEVPVICTGHCYVRNSRLEESESDKAADYVGGEQAVGAGIFASYDYAALGHIHLRQRVSGNAWYSGSPLPVNFGEAGYANGVSLVSFAGNDPGGGGFRPEVRHVPLKRPVEFVRVPERGGFAAEKEAIETLEAIPEAEDGGAERDRLPYCSVFVEYDPGDSEYTDMGFLRDRIRSLMNARTGSVRECDVKIVLRKAGSGARGDAEEESRSPDDLREPLRIVERMYRKRRANGDPEAVLPGEMKDALLGIIAELEAEDGEKERERGGK